MFVFSLSFEKNQIAKYILDDVERYLKSMMERYIEIYAYEFFELVSMYQLCFYTETNINFNTIDFIKNKVRVSGLFAMLEVYENKLIYGGNIYGKKKC